MGESAPDDLALVRRTLAGDREAFDPLVRRHQKSVYAVVYGILRSASDAEDAAQDVFLRAYRYLPSYDSSRSFEGWLMAIAVNQARGLRSSRRTEAARVDPTSFAAGRVPATSLAFPLRMQSMSSKRTIAFLGTSLIALTSDRSLNSVKLIA